MARDMVTRTVKGTSVRIKKVDTVTEQIVEDTVLLPKSYTDEAKLKKAVSKAIEPAILVSVVETTEVNKCYGIPASKFMEFAVELDTATRQVIETATVTEE